LPLREFAAGRILFHLMIALIQTVILLTVGRVLFGVHVVGNVLALLPLVLFGSLCFIALGMCIGGRVNTEDATAALSNLIVLPMVFLGGVFFPLAAAPSPVRVVAHFLPLTYLAEGLQNVAVRGHSFSSTLPNLGVLALIAVLLTALALRLFRWQTV
jgi:ABC-2 type transport system permease protein